MRAAIVGGGIGGLAAAVALRRVGVDTVVFERAERMDPLGAGLTLSPNAVRALARLGLAANVRAVAASGRELEVKTAAGTSLMRIKLDDSREMLGVHRADLQRVLLDAAGEVRLDNDVREVDEIAGDVDFVVGADGIESTVRAQLHGPDAPREAGYVGWRAVCEFDDDRVRGRFTETWGCGERVGLIPIGGGRVYWFVAESGRPRDYERFSVRDQFAKRLADWHAPIPAVIAATRDDALSWTEILWRKPLKTWGRGRITLLGDAAHAMTPDLGQGAGQALEDAVVLAACVRDGPDVEASLRRCEAERIGRTTRIVKRSRQFGRLASASRGWTCALRDALVAHTPASVQARQQAHVLDYELPEL
jgi:2-polyprenyl-6-methoxyphenol hydroxylase-like FAD-dependent oxidoreductase